MHKSGEKRCNYKDSVKLRVKFNNLKDYFLESLVLKGFIYC